MIMDNLEEYIRKHREEMDRYKPSSGIWKGIRKGLKPGKSSLYQLFSIAAMVAVILGTALYFFRPGYKLSQKSAGKGNYETMINGNSQLKETEIYYNNLANSLYREVTPMLTRNPEIENELSADMSQIDSICSEIKKDLKDNVATQDVIEALIQNYRIKIRLLEDVVTVLKENKENPEKHNGHEL